MSPEKMASHEPTAVKRDPEDIRKVFPDRGKNLKKNLEEVDDKRYTKGINNRFLFLFYCKSVIKSSLMFIT
jgi:hypothetical protein